MKLRLRHSGKRLGLLLIASVALVLFFSQAALAQSGRRQNKTAPPPPPPPTTTTTTSEPKTDDVAATPAAKTTASATVIVGGDRFNSSNYALSGYVGYAVQSCMDRLKESHALEVIGGGNMSRKEAIDRAKKEQQAYVLWLELRVDDDANATLVEIEYTLLAAQTAKIRASGRVYLGNKRVGAGGVGVGIPSVSNRLPLQYQLKEGGKEVADRVKGKIQVYPQD